MHIATVNRNVVRTRIKAVLLIVLMLCSMLCVGGNTGAAEENVANAVKAKKISISGPQSVVKGKKITLTAEVSPSAASQKVSWKSSDKSIATVSSKGVVTGKAAGKVKITATSKSNKKVKKTFTVEVKEKISKITITGAKTLDLNGTKKVKLKAKASPSKATQSFTWKSSDTKVAKVDQKGNVKAVGTGTAKITATAMDGSNKKATVKIKVIDSSKSDEEEVTETPTPTPIKTGWQQEDGKTRYYDENGNMVTGWYRIEQYWYYFKKDGELLVHDPNLDGDKFLDLDNGDSLPNDLFRDDGAYDIFAGWFERSFLHYDEETDDFVGTPLSLTIKGKACEIKWLDFDIEEDGTGVIHIDEYSGEQRTLTFSCTWKWSGYKMILTSEAGTWTFIQEKYDKFILDVGSTKLTMMHGMGWG